VQKFDRLWEQVMERTDYEKCQRPRAARFSLEPARKLLEELDLELPVPGVVHLAGSKGKGSTASFIERGARAAGISTGLFTSPHLSEWTERICIDGEAVSKAALSEALERVLALSSGDETFFDLITATSVLVFANANCELWIMETGLGGRFDSTNALPSTISLVTSIELEHTDVLGDTLQKIAYEKSGIYKAGSMAWTSLPESHPVFEQLKLAASEAGSELHVLPDEYQLPSQFPYQQQHMRRNFAMAEAILGQLNINVEVMHSQAPAYWQLPGRFELRHLPDGRQVVFDIAHSADSLNSVLQCFRDRWPSEKTAILFALRDDKDACKLAEDLSPERRPEGEHWYALPAGNHPRSADPEVLAQAFSDFSAQAICELGFPMDHDVMLVTGSTYLVGALRSLTSDAP